MNERDEKFKFDHYINLIFKHRWLIIIPFCLAMIVGIYLALTLPRIYQAYTSILVRPQQVPTDYVQSIVTADLESRIRSISQQILSRSNLEKIISQFNLFSGPEQQNMAIEDKISNLREQIAIETQPTKDRPETDAFYIFITGANPDEVMRVANGLATLFIDENLKKREAEAVETTEFLEDELRAMRTRLEEVEIRLKDYRKRYMGELPEQLESNLRILDTYQRQLSENEDRLRDEKNRLVMLENEIKNRKESLSAGNAIESDSAEAVTLLQLKNQLAALQSSYTERHPDIIRLKAKIADMEAKLRSGELKMSAEKKTDLSQDQLLTSKILGDQIRQQNQIKLEIQDLEEDIRKLKYQIKIYQQRIERTPKREEELIALNRDYNNIQASYSSLLNRKLEAEIAVSMEKKQKGEQFSILDRAYIPREPISPNMKRLIMLAVMAGLGIGGGLIFLLDYFNTSLKNPEDFELDLGVSVLATIPKVYQKKDFRLKRLNQLLTAFSLVVAACLFAGFAALVFYGVEPTIEIVRPYIDIASLKI
jgi:polysaccharide chain length determinant protein (PEP-CTERM system associated)